MSEAFRELLRLRFGDRPCQVEVSVGKAAGSVRAAPSGYVVVIPEDWEERVYRRGLANIRKTSITLDLRPVLIPEGADNAWQGTFLTHLPHYAGWKPAAVVLTVVSYGGMYWFSSNPVDALERGRRYFEKKILEGK